MATAGRTVFNPSQPLYPIEWHRPGIVVDSPPTVLHSDVANIICELGAQNLLDTNGCKCSKPPTGTIYKSHFGPRYPDMALVGTSTVENIVLHCWCGDELCLANMEFSVCDVDMIRLATLDLMDTNSPWNKEHIMNGSWFRSRKGELRQLQHGQEPVQAMEEIRDVDVDVDVEKSLRKQTHDNLRSIFG